ncbi:MAG: hypothetical protein C0469_07225 [Cyanobacteria bacterium DS2.3.42]|nr:hypothetical protein [Cyanobacteria bacterium DS2.3.42]
MWCALKDQKVPENLGNYKPPNGHTIEVGNVYGIPAEWVTYDDVKGGPEMNIAIGSAYLAMMIKKAGGDVGKAMGQKGKGGGYGTGSDKYDKIRDCEACLKKQLKTFGPPNIDCCLGQGAKNLK